MLRPDTAQELKATLILSMPIEEGSAKVRAGDPEDDEDDYGWPVWAGVIPVHTATLPPQADPRNLPDIELPAHIAEFKWEKQVIDR